MYHGTPLLKLQEAMLQVTLFVTTCSFVFWEYQREFYFILKILGHHLRMMSHLVLLSFDITWTKLYFLQSSFVSMICGDFFNVLLSDQNFVFQMDLLNFHVHAIFGISDTVAIRTTSSVDIFCLEKNKMKIIIPYNP